MKSRCSGVSARPEPTGQILPGAKIVETPPRMPRAPATPNGGCAPHAPSAPTVAFKAPELVDRCQTSPDGEAKGGERVIGVRFAHARERQSRCVTTAGPGRRARSAVSHTSLGMVAVRENPAWCGRLRVGVAHRRQGRRKAGAAVHPRRHRTGRSAARPDADRRQELLRPRLRGRPQPGCPPHLLRPARQGEPARPGAQFFRPLRQTIESVNDTLKGQLDLERHGGHTPAGVITRVLQRILALTAAIWHNDDTASQSCDP